MATFTYTIKVEVPGDEDEVDEFGETALDRANGVIAHRVYMDEPDIYKHRCWCVEWDGPVGRSG